MASRTLSAMTPEELEAKVAALKPAWALDYIRQLEALTRTLHAQLTETQEKLAAAQAQGAEDLNLAREISGARDRLADAAADLHEHPEGTHAHPYTRPDHDHIIAEGRIAEAPEDAYDPSDPDGPPRPVPAGLLPPHGEYVTARVLDGRNGMEPLADLPEGAEVRFADFYQVRYGDHETTGDARMLIVETDTPLVVRPAGQTTVLIARG